MDDDEDDDVARGDEGRRMLLGMMAHHWARSVKRQPMSGPVSQAAMIGMGFVDADGESEDPIRPSQQGRLAAVAEGSVADQRHPSRLEAAEVGQSHWRCLIRRWLRCLQRLLRPSCYGVS